MIIFAGFTFALTNLYWYYNPNVRNFVQVVVNVDANNNTASIAEGLFGTIDLTFKTIFWAIFGLGAANNINLSPFKNYVTENFGFFLYGTFHIASIVLLLNMLIAMMTKSYEAILTHSDVEWKFARSKLYMEFIKEGDELPVPLNLLPTPKMVMSIIDRIRKKKSAPQQSKAELGPPMPNGRAGGAGALANGAPGKHANMNGRGPKRDAGGEEQAIHHALNNHDTSMTTELTYKVLIYFLFNFLFVFVFPI